MGKIAGLVVGIVVLGFAGLYGYLGGFTSVAVTEQSFGPVEFVYSTHRGAYKNLSKSWDRFKEQWEAAGLEVCDSMAVYLDSPETPEDQLRSIIACRIDSLPTGVAPTVGTNLPSFTLPESMVIAGFFPFKTELSYFLGPMKVYPKFTEYMEENDIKPTIAIETYGVEGKQSKMGYYMPIGASQSQFKPLFDAFTADPIKTVEGGPDGGTETTDQN
jgi:hypothetical protein